MRTPSRPMSLVALCLACLIGPFGVVWTVEADWSAQYQSYSSEYGSWTGAYDLPPLICHA